MSRQAAASFDLPSDGRARRRVYHAVAAALAVAGRGASALFESEGGTGAPTADVRPVDLLVGLGAPAVPRPRPVREVPWPEGDPPAVGYLVAAGPSSSAGTLPELRELVEPDTLLGPAGQFRIQTFWAGGHRDGRLWVARRFLVRGVPAPVRRPAIARLESAVAAEWSVRVGRRVVAASAPRRTANDWRRGRCRAVPRDAWFALSPAFAERTAEPEVFVAPNGLRAADAPLAVFGATGSGKTWHLARIAAAEVERGGRIVVIDLHGDLGPALLDRLGPEGRARLIAIDASVPGGPGLAALHGEHDRAAAHFVAAVKRLSPDGGEIYWGFRLERVFDAFVRLVLETGGSLTDLYGLLTDPERRDVARLTTRRPELAKFLEELGPIVRRTPDFLWPAAARLSKIALVPALAALLAPPDGGIDLEGALRHGRSIVVRLPFAQLGAEAAAFAASLLLARAYYGVAARAGPGTVLPVGAVLDEAHGFSPRLLTELLTEGRKFGFRLVVASQYPDRLAPELRAAVAGSVRDVTVFRTPPAAAASVGGWLGLAPTASAPVLAGLAAGVGVRRSAVSGDLLAFPPGPAVASDDGAWPEAVARTTAEFPPGAGEEVEMDAVTERLLLAVVAAEEEGRPVRRDRLAEAIARFPGEAVDAAVAAEQARHLAGHGLLAAEGACWTVPPAGLRALGLTTSTGATSESSEHRALLVRAFRLFARRGCRIEIVRQGRFDTTLPDALFRQLPRGGPRSPRELADALELARQGWAWRFFGGRDVHLEAEVSGALRPERIRRGVVKAVRRDAFPLFLVGDAHRARRVRTTLRRLGLGPDRAQVWLLAGAGEAGGAGGPLRDAPDEGETR